MSAFGDVHNMPPIKNPRLDSKWHFLVPFSKKLIAFSSAISCMGIMFYSLHWPGAVNQLITGASSLIVCIFIILYLRSKNDDLIRQSLLIRAVALVSILGYVWYFAS
jgi:hypothetical protein